MFLIYKTAIAKRLREGVVFLLFAFGQNTFAANLEDYACPPFRHTFGPFDYRTATSEQKGLVEGAHFPADVEHLRKGKRSPSGGYIMVPGQEIDYTLRAFPNHPRALLSLSRLSAQERTDKPTGIKVKVDCYFHNAITRWPDDSMVRVIYGTYLTQRKNAEEALKQFEKAQELGSENPSMYYNLGLAYFEIKRYPESLEAAHKAYSLGFPFPGLRNKLESVGHWQNPVVKSNADNSQTTHDDAGNTPAQ